MKNCRQKRPGTVKYLSITLMISVFVLSGCFPALKTEVQDPDQALIPVKYFYPEFQDDMDLGSLAMAIEKNLEYLDRLNPGHLFTYGPHSFTCDQVRDSQKAFLKLILNASDSAELNRNIKKHFRVYRAAGRVGNRRVLFTGYFEPIFDANLTPDNVFKFPVYRMPDNLIRIDLSFFNKKFKGESVTGRIEGKKVMPYYSRQQIEEDNVLRGRNLEIAWLKDPVDVAFLHIQGSGRLRLKDGKMISVGYMASNGRPYRSIGRYMLDKGLLNMEDMSMQSIRRYLSEHPGMVDKVLNYNPSYVFFRIREDGPLGNISVPLTPGRSVALNARLFPKGALCFISCEKPVINSNGEIQDWIGFSRFVLNQDTGGAIRGSGRADIFWGSDPYAEQAAGHMRHEGELYVLIKKPQT